MAGPKIVNFENENNIESEDYILLLIYLEADIWSVFVTTFPVNLHGELSTF